MKAVFLTIFATLALGSLFGCHNRSTAQNAPLEPMQQSYRGVLPCGSHCEATESSLFLAADGSYVLEQRVNGESAIRTAQYGKWARTADTLTLVASNGEKQLFRPTDQGLEAISWRGVPVGGRDHYHLTAARAAL